MSTRATVLYDAPGPRAVRINRILTVIVSLALIALLASVLWALGNKGQLDGDKWNIFTKGSSWTTYIIPGLWATVKAAVLSIILALIVGAVLGIGRLSTHRSIRWICSIIVEVFRSYGGLVILSALLFAGNNAVGYMTTGGYIQGMTTRPIEEGGFGYNPVHVQLAVLGAAAVWFLSTLISGWLCDIFGRKAILLIGFAITLVTVVFLFEAAKNGPLGIFMGTGLVSIGLGFTYGPQAVMYAETFPAHIRFSGVAISYAIGAILGGAFAPTIAQSLLSSTGTTWSIVIYLGVMTLVGAAATALLRERRDVPLSIEAEEDGTWAAWRGDKVDPSPAPVR